MKKYSSLIRACAVAAIYVVLTYASSIFGISSGPVQLRVSEAMCILPVFMPAAVPGLGVGCFIANLLLPGAQPIDAIFGSLATLIGAYGTLKLRKWKILPYIPPVLANMIIIPFVLQYAYGLTGSYWYFMLTIGMGEILSVGVLGYFLRSALLRTKFF